LACRRWRSPGSWRCRRSRRVSGGGPGRRWLRGTLGGANTSGARSKDTYLHSRFGRIAARCGKKRALVAVGHSIVTATWHLIRNDVDYADLGTTYISTRTLPNKPNASSGNSISSVTKPPSTPSPEAYFRLRSASVTSVWPSPVP
jgi:hypothetical protein